MLLGEGLGYRLSRGQAWSWWHDLPDIRACRLAATWKEPEACECPSHTTCISKCEGTSVASEGSCSEGPGSALKRMWVDRLPGSRRSHDRCLARQEQGKGRGRGSCKAAGRKEVRGQNAAGPGESNSNSNMGRRYHAPLRCLPQTLPAGVPSH